MTIYIYIYLSFPPEHSTAACLSLSLSFLRVALPIPHTGYRGESLGTSNRRQPSFKVKSTPAPTPLARSKVVHNYRDLLLLPSRWCLSFHPTLGIIAPPFNRRDFTAT